MKRLIATLPALVGLLLAAQTPLTGEVNVEHAAEAVTLPAVVRPDIAVPISLPPLTPPQLFPSLTPQPAHPEYEAAWLEPVAPALGDADSRGCVTAGLFPLVFNGRLGARYDILRRPDTRLRAWLGYRTANYRRSHTPIFRRHNLAAGATLTHAFSPTNTLDVTAMYGMRHYNYPSHRWVTAQRALAGARWQAKAGALDYGLHLRYMYYGFAGHGAMRQSDFRFGGHAALPLADSWALRVDAAAETHQVPDAEGTHIAGLATLTPALLFEHGNVGARVGARLDFTFRQGKGFHIAPDVRLQWVPKTLPLAAEITFGGGETTNPLGQVAARTPWLAPGSIYGFSHLTYRAGAAITIGPFTGTWLRLYADWAHANQWLLPVVATPGLTVLAPFDLRGGRLGAEVGAQPAPLEMEVSARYEYATSGSRHVRYTWIDAPDRARHTLHVRIALSPLTPLRLSAAYQLRAQRSMAMLSADLPPVNLHNLSLLTLRAQWRFTPQLAVWAEGTNLLGKRYTGLDLAPAQGRSALIGATLTL